ncbi:MAG: hypothetical protein HY396_02735 [Candidatus Doudnabacteria bacterium]|nr:hypothetical protein [Candidatus Doudnabacteria bacterium]
MKKSPEHIPQVTDQKGPSERFSDAYAVERIYAEALHGESFEDALAALQSVEALQSFRKKASALPFGSFHELVEEVTNVNRLLVAEEERAQQLYPLIETLEQKAIRFSPRVADLYSAMLAEIKGELYEAKFDMTREKLNELKQTGDLDVLFSQKFSWEMKLNRIEARLIDYLSGARALDKREGREMDDDILKWREEELKKAPTHPFERRSESKPGVDPMERLKEGERAPAIWSIYPAWGGYYKEQSFSVWDSSRNVWTEEKYIYHKAEIVPLSGNADHKKGPTDITMSAKVFAGQWVTLPVPYTHGLHEIEAGGKNYSAQQDQNGDLVFLVEGSGEVEIKVLLAPHPEKKFKSDPSTVRVPEMPSEFTEETVSKLEEIKNKKRGHIARARAITSYVRSRIKYLAPKDRAEAEHYNHAYNTHPGGFARAVDELKAADCDVANTYFAALCAKLNIPVRHAVGHSVKGRNKEGASSIHSGTGHGWSEVWDEVRKEWMRMDTTPAGDHNLEEEEKGEGASAPGDYGGEEAVRPSDKDLEELRQKLAERKEELSYTKEERELAEGAGVELKEARKIVKEIAEAERTRLPSGELVVDALAKLFNAIVESRKNVAPAYEGLVRKREGGERIQDIVRHKIGAMGGETDPLSREKLEEETKEEKILGGFDLYIIGDKSGSMQSVSEKDEHLWQAQRRAMYLILSSLYRFERSVERAGFQKENALSVRAESLSFRGNSPEEIDIDKLLSPQFMAQDKVKLWHSLTEQGSGNGDPEALSIVYEQIKMEVEEIEKQGAKDNRLRLVIACSDGGYVGNDSARMQMLSKMISELRANAVVVGLGLTKSAATVPVVMENPPYSRGEIVRNISDLPAVVAKYVVQEAVKLFPDKAREGARQIIESSIAKFKNIK